MSDVPTVIVVNVLSRLPVKSLLRSRCVCKPWCALIDSPYFVKFQLNQSIETNNNLSLILGSDSGLYSIDSNTLDNAIKLEVAKCTTAVVGTCNGLICLKTTSAIVSERGMAIWNPSTRKYKMMSLPLGPIRRSTNWGDFSSFGYDHVNDDYKVVRVLQNLGDPFNSEVMVYSLKSDSWHRVRECPCHLCFQLESSVFVSGVLHWIACQKPKPGTCRPCPNVKLIAAFDLGTEEYRLVPKPEHSHMDFYATLVVLGGCLCMVYNYHGFPLDIWVMKKYAVKKSWIKLISVARPNESKPFWNLRPIAYSKSRREVLLEEDNKRFIWYDLEEKTMKNVTICGLPELFVADAFLESLVQLPGGGGGSDAKKQQAEGEKKKKKKKKKKNAKKTDDFP